MLFQEKFFANCLGFALSVWFFGALTFNSSWAFAANFCPHKILDSYESKAHVEAELQSIISDLVNQHLPELKAYKLALKPFENQDDFFRSNLTLSSEALSPQQRNYQIEYNVKILRPTFWPGKQALRAIILHELKHTVDLISSDLIDLVLLGSRYILELYSTYERKTDEFVLEHSYACGLKYSREWLYAKVSKEALGKKKINYYTPEEIETWRAKHPFVPDAL